MRITRSAHDDALAELLLSTGLQSFVEMWYKKEMWERYVTMTNVLLEKKILFCWQFVFNF